MRSRRSLVCLLVSALLLALAGAANAVVYDISVKNRNFCCTNPPVFIAGVPQAKGGYATVVATASQTGAAPAPIKIGMGHAVNFYSMFFVPDLPQASLKTNSGTASLFNGAGVLAKNGGNAASFSFCPKNVGLPAPGACTNPANATPTSQGFNGRVRVTPGKNKFGGTLQILAGAGGLGGSKFFVYRFVGANLTQTPAALVNGGFKDAPIGAMTPGYAVTFPNPAMTGMKSTGFMSKSFPNQALFQAGAGPFTTGMVTLQITMQAGKLPVRSLMLAGYDNRTAGGLGNIQVVSGLLANGFNGSAPGGTPIGHTMRISFIPEPTASLGLAAGAFGLLLVGLRHARRSNQE